ncbi:MAG TPA: NAD-dependent epimerase/dehydratase family protein [Bacteroidales bacterium]|nr:NAD-dependent epimerase/dehydratase family protein [Bacteroidales bacterium]
MILVTGGTGLVGTQLIYDLLVKGKQVRAIKRKSSSIAMLEKIFRLKNSKADAMLSKIEWFEADVQDYLSLEAVVQGVEQIYHCAAVVSFDPKEKSMMMRINIEGTANVVNVAMAHGVKKLCFVSSVAALGRAEENIMIDEKADWIESKENSAYAVSKYAAEREVWRGMAEGLNAVIVNPSIIIGLGDPKKSSAKLLATARKGNPFYTEGVNAFVDVRDVSRAMIELMESEITNERFIVNAGNYSYRHIFNLMAKGFGKKAPNVHVKPWMFEILWRTEKFRSLFTGKSPLITRETAHTSGKRYLYSNKKISKVLNFKFISIEESIRENCRWFDQISW